MFAKLLSLIALCAFILLTTGVCRAEPFKLVIQNGGMTQGGATFKLVAAGYKVWADTMQPLFDAMLKTPLAGSPAKTAKPVGTTSQAASKPVIGRVYLAGCARRDGSGACLGSGLDGRAFPLSESYYVP